MPLTSTIWEILLIFLREVAKMQFSTLKTPISLLDTCSVQQKKFLCEHPMKSILEKGIQEL